MIGSLSRSLLVGPGLLLLFVPAWAAPASTAEALAATLRESVPSCDQARLDHQRLAPYYAAEAPEPLWVDADGPRPRARLLLTALQNAPKEGLTPTRYRVSEIEAHWTADGAPAQACLDLLLTSAFDRYSRDLRLGRTSPQEADPSWMLRPADFDPVTALRGAADDNDFARLFDALPPAHAAYARLRAALGGYRERAREGEAGLPPGPTIEPDDEHEQVPLLRARLRREGDLAALTLSYGQRYDATLVEAVRRFQRRHGLFADGVVGPRTRAALAVPAAERAAQLRRAMERLRWLPRELGTHYILVNTAGFELAVIEHGKTVLRMRTINGTPDQATPSFSATLRSLIINPFWYVPERIARERLWPREQARPGYLAARGFRIFDTSNGNWQELDRARIDWALVNSNASTLRLRQDPGPRNLMGRLSFVFPNLHDVFLHDTPDRALFERDTRTFSEGCVRIDNAMALALHTLRRTPEWSAARIQEEIDAMHHTTLSLPEPIPVYVLYLPAWVDDDGQVQFRGDWYQREAVLAGYYPAN
jgi:murein L,D-transpeptidase YcbB/YkuD